MNEEKVIGITLGKIDYILLLILFCILYNFTHLDLCLEFRKIRLK
jgi:hypothetical protein